MKKISKNLLSLLFLLATTVMFSQGKIKGTVVDSELNSSLPGVNVVIKGTTSGTTTDFDGNFTLNAATSGQVVLTYVGYQNTTISFTVKNGETVDLGTIKMSADAGQLDEVVVKSSVIDVAKDRKTPVAVSTIKASEIQQKLGNQEFPEILANTPSVYATKAGGGFGDSRINIRGFDQRNIAVMINGVPVNDMENSSVYWSNWAGLSDVTSAMQVQRGLGSSKLAISSVGGTINVVTRTSEMKEGGSFSAGIANNNYLKLQGSYSTGKMKNGLSFSFLLSRTQGNGYVDGTKFEGHNYFVALGYEFSQKSDIQFTFTGAPQWHNQRNFANTLADYIKYGDAANNEPNIKYNSDWGYLKGEEYSWARNFYHKPVASVNWDYKFNDRMKLSSVFYGSWGRGGGTGNIGKSPFAFKTADGLVPFDDFYAYNTGTYSFPSGNSTTTLGTPLVANSNGQFVTNRGAGFTRRASMNSHDWYGAVINLNTKLTDELTLDFGVDARTYIGYHYRIVNDRLGADAYQADLATSGATYIANDVNNPTRTLYETYSATPSFNPWTNITNQEKIEYNNNGYVRWYGAFSQLEYNKNDLSAFVQGSLSQQGFKREDKFQYSDTNPLQTTSYKNLMGYNLKAGTNYNINDKMNVFANAGAYSKQPAFNAVYAGNKNVENPNLTNEKVVGFEAGYGFKSKYFTANLNAYYTSWADRYIVRNDNATANLGGYFEVVGADEVHSGLELELTAKPIAKLGVNGMVSIGNWEYNNNPVLNKYDVSNTQIITEKPLYLDGVKVGDAAQITASLGANYEITKNLKVDANYRYNDKLYAAIDAEKFVNETNKGTLELPNYGLLDAGISFKMLVDPKKTNTLDFRFNINNVLDKIYISESRTNIFADDYVSGTTGPTYESAGKLYDGVATGNQVFFGFGRTWNLTLRYNF